MGISSGMGDRARLCFGWGRPSFPGGLTLGAAGGPVLAPGPAHPGEGPGSPGPRGSVGGRCPAVSVGWPQPDPPGDIPPPSPPHSRYLQQSRGAAVALQQPPVEQHPLAHQPQDLPPLVQGVGGLLLLRALQRLRTETGTSQGHQHGWWGAGGDPHTCEARIGWEIGVCPEPKSLGDLGVPWPTPEVPPG